MAPATLTYTYCDSDDLDALLSSDGVEGRLDDNDDGLISTDELAFRTKAINWGTAQVNFHCLSRYSAQSLAQSWLVNNWCVICAGYWLSCRRGNPPPGSLDALYSEAIEDMKLVHAGIYEVADIAQRGVAWPAWSNIRVDILYNLRRMRVERPISERSTPSKHIDVAANFIVEPNG